MTKIKNFKLNENVVRDSLMRVVELSDKILANEQILMEMLYEIDQHKYYVRFGYRSLMGFCNHGLRLTKTQSLRVVTNVRRSTPKTQRSDPAANIGKKKENYSEKFLEKYPEKFKEEILGSEYNFLCS